MSWTGPRDNTSRKESKMDVLWSNLKADTQKIVSNVEKVYKVQLEPIFSRPPASQQGRPPAKSNANAGQYHLANISTTPLLQSHSATAQPPNSSIIHQPERIVLRESPYQNQQQVRDHRSEPSHAQINGHGYKREDSRHYGAQSYSPMSNQIYNLSTRSAAPLKWTPPPDQGFRTTALRERLAEHYGIQQQTIQEAINFADTEDFADVYCFAFCLTGGPMAEAFNQAAMHSFDRARLIESFEDPKKGIAGPLTAQQQKAKERAIQALNDAQQAELDDADIWEEEEMERLREEVEGLPLEEALQCLGMSGPGFGLRDIQRELFPGTGILTRSKQENAKRAAAYNVAIEIFERD